MRCSLKKVLSVILCSLMVFSLSACGNSTDDNDGVETVVFWHSFSGETGEALETIIEAYNEGQGAEKGIEVELVYQGYEGTDKVILAYQTKDYANAPDINVGLTSTIPSVMDMDWTVNVEEFLNDSDSEISKDTFYEALQVACSYEGSMVAIPFANSIPLLYYNIEMFEEAGFEEAPSTMDELVEYVEALTVMDGSTVTTYGLNMQVKRYQLVEFCVSQSTSSYFGNNEGGRTEPMTEITAGEDGTMEAFLEKLQALLDTGGYKYIEDSPNEEFAQGLSAMVIMSSSRMGTLDGLMPGEYMTAYLPKVNETDDGGAAVGGSCLNLFDRGDEGRLEAAWDVMQYLVSPENQYIFSTASGYIPVNVETENLEEMKAYYEENPQYLVALEQMKDADASSQEPLDLTYNEINSVITETMLEFCQGGLTIQETIDTIVNKSNALLDEYHEVN